MARYQNSYTSNKVNYPTGIPDRWEDKQMARLDSFTQGYIAAALWSSTAYNSPEERKQDPNHEGRFDASFKKCGYNRLSRALVQQIDRDCAAFQRDNANLLAVWYAEFHETPERAGQDFWFTRNHHGAGFWDRWTAGDIGAKLTEAAHAYGSVDLYYHRGRVCA